MEALRPTRYFRVRSVPCRGDASAGRTSLERRRTEVAARIARAMLEEGAAATNEGLATSNRSHPSSGRAPLTGRNSWPTPLGSCASVYVAARRHPGEACTIGDCHGRYLRRRHTPTPSVESPFARRLHRRSAGADDLEHWPDAGSAGCWTVGGGDGAHPAGCPPMASGSWSDVMENGRRSR